MWELEAPWGGGGAMYLDEVLIRDRPLSNQVFVGGHVSFKQVS